jgi:hypothetical protein
MLAVWLVCPRNLLFLVPALAAYLLVMAGVERALFPDDARRLAGEIGRRLRRA